MAIKLSLTLEGTEKVESQLDSVAKKGEDLSKSFNEIGKGGIGVDKIANDLKSAGLNFDQTADKAEKFGSSLKIVSAGLKLIGIDIGGVGAAARVLNSSLALAGAGIAGGIIVALGKLEEQTARTQGQLADVFGSQAKGQQAFSALNKQAQEFGSSVQNLAPGLIALETGLNNVNRAAQGFVALRPQDLPGALAAPSIQQAADAYGNFLKLLRAGRDTQAEAEKTATDFFNAFRDGGAITSAALKNLPAGTLKELQAALGASGLTAKQFFDRVDQGNLTLDKFIVLLSKIGPAAQKAFDEKAIDTMGDAFDRVLAKLQSGLKGATGQTFSEQTISFLGATEQDLTRIGQIFDFLARRFDEMVNKEKQAQFPTAIQGDVPLPRPKPEQLEALGKFKDGAVDATNSLERLGAAGLNAGAKVAQGANTGTAALKQMQLSTEQLAQQDLASLESGGPSLEGAGGQAAKGRLGQIPVSVPQLAGEGGTTQGKEFGTTWVQAVQTEIQNAEIEFDINTQIDEAQRTAEINLDTQPAQTQAQTLFEQIKQFFTQPIPLNIQSGDIGTTITPFASGGAVRGPGSTTSDSIMALLSNREWVINAKAVDFYGSSLFAALNSMRLPRSLIGGIPKFAEGGPVTHTASTLNLILGGRSFTTTTSDETLNSLRRFAVHSQLASIGRKPGFVR